MSQVDIDAASREYQEQQAYIAASLIQEILDWWRTLGYQAVDTDLDRLWETYHQIVTEHRTTSRNLAVDYHNRVRALAVGEQSVTLRGEVEEARRPDAETRQAAASFFTHVAPVAREIKKGRLDDPDFLNELMGKTGTNLARDGARLAEEGGRDALRYARNNDPAVIGFYRRTDDDPCGFCAMLASRGAVYTAGRNASRRTRTWLNDQDPDQYHPDCHCQTLPLFEGTKMPPEDEAKRKRYEAAWKNTKGSGATQMKNFRDAFDAERKERNKQSDREDAGG